MKIFSYILFALALTGCSSQLPAFPPAAIPDSPAAGDWPDAGAAILDESRTLEFRESSAGDRQRLIAVLVHRVRYKVLSERGLRHAKMRLPVDGYSSISKVAARSVHPDGRQFYLRQVDIVPRDERGRPVPVGAVGNVSLQVPNPMVGGLLEFQYERVSPIRHGAALGFRPRRAGSSHRDFSDHATERSGRLQLRSWWKNRRTTSCFESIVRRARQIDFVEKTYQLFILSLTAHMAWLAP